MFSQDAVINTGLFRKNDRVTYRGKMATVDHVIGVATKVQTFAILKYDDGTFTCDEGGGKAPVALRAMNRPDPGEARHARSSLHHVGPALVKDPSNH